MLRRAVSIYKGFINLLLGEHIPVWLSLVLMFAGAYATYELAPSINQKFEIQAARREFLVENMNTFANNTKELIDIVSKALNEDNQKSYLSLIVDVNLRISQLQFSSVQLLYVVPENSNEINAFQETLSELQRKVTLHRVQDDPQYILEDIKDASRRSLELYSIMLRKAGLGS